jgi:hypothetical protein
MIGPNLSSSDVAPDDEEDDDPAPGLGVAAGRTGLVVSGARTGSEREAAGAPLDGAADEASDGAVVALEADVVAVGDAVPGDWTGPADAGVGASSSIGTPIWRAFSAAARTSDGSLTDAITTTGAELNSVELTPAATASGVWPANTVVQSLGSRTPAAEPPPELPLALAVGRAPPTPAEQAASANVDAASNPIPRSRASRRTRVPAATETPRLILCSQGTVGRVPPMGNRTYAVPFITKCSRKYANSQA